jgi:hypothetical protein
MDESYAKGFIAGAKAATKLMLDTGDDIESVANNLEAMLTQLEEGMKKGKI